LFEIKIPTFIKPATCVRFDVHLTPGVLTLMSNYYYTCYSY